VLVLLAHLDRFSSSESIALKLSSAMEVGVLTPVWLHWALSTAPCVDMLPQGDEESQERKSSGLAVLSKPLCISVNNRTFQLLGTILGRLCKPYFHNDKYCSVCDHVHGSACSLTLSVIIYSRVYRCTSEEYFRQMYSLVAVLRVLKAHLYQLVRSQLPAEHFAIT